MEKLLVMLVLCTCSVAMEQQPPPLVPVKLSDFKDTKPSYCGERIAVLDGIHQKTPADDSIIIIARLGNGDKRLNLNRRRLHNVRVYWTEFLYEGHRRKPGTVILAEGEPVKGFGHLEFYVGEKLVYVMKVAPNADLFVGSCYPPDDSFIKNRAYNPCRVESDRNFYPCRDKHVPRRRGR